MLLLSQKFSYIRSIFRTRDWAKIIVFFAFVLIAVLVAIAAYFGFLHGFRFFARDVYFGDALALYTLEATILIVAALVFLSAAVSGIFTLFATRENQFLLATPVGRTALFASRFFENAFASAWPIVLIVIPAVLALARVFHLGLWQVLGFTATFFGVFVLAVTLAAIIDFVLLCVFRAIRGVVLAVIIILLLVGAAYGVGKILLPASLPALFQAEEFRTPRAGRDLLMAHFRSYPTHAPALYLAGATAPRDVARSAVYTLLEAAGALGLLSWLVRGFYPQLLIRSFEGTFIARPEDRMHMQTGLKNFPILTHTPFGALLEKDIMTFLRSTRELSRAAFLIFMLLLYLFLFRRLPLHDGALSADVLAKVLLFNLAATGYFLTTLALRFVFPIISLEGKSAWALFASPLPRVAIFWEKWLIGIVPILLVIVPLSISSLHLIGVSGLAMLAFLRYVVWMAITLVTLSLAIGTRWPNFSSERDPDRLSTTVPGLAVTALSLGYVALMSVLGFLAMRTFFVEKKIFPPTIFLAALPTLLLLGMGVWLGIRWARKIEIV